MGLKLWANENWMAFPWKVRTNFTQITKASQNRSMLIDTSRFPCHYVKYTLNALFIITHKHSNTPSRWEAYWKQSSKIKCKLINYGCFCFISSNHSELVNNLQFTRKYMRILHCIPSTTVATAQWQQNKQTIVYTHIHTHIHVCK